MIFAAVFTSALVVLAAGAWLGYMVGLEVGRDRGRIEADVAAALHRRRHAGTVHQ